ncbi:MAG: tyrosine-protein phosphatase [Coriobacteriales bacterium]|jgi:protein-tyrosine phosphatase|nr:tyrosine-protein phosphatase [Coriobacteriales bacterium]
MFYTFEGIQNFRDLSGITRADGAKVRPKALMRSGNFSQASEADLTRLHDDFGPWAVVDFRGETELEDSPDQPVAGASYHSLPTVDMNEVRDMDDPRHPGERIHIRTSADLVDSPDRPSPAELAGQLDLVYQLLATSTRATAAYRAFFELALEAAGRPLLWHCTQGKDRAGVGTFLMLRVLGFDIATATAEYMLSARFFQGVLDHLEAQGTSAADLAFYRPILLPERRRLNIYLDALDQERGGLEAYLGDDLGMTAAKRQQLQAAYLFV